MISSREARSIPAAAVVTDDPGLLARILEANVNLVVWRRAVSAELTSYVDQVLAPGRLKRQAGVLEDVLAGLPPAPGWFEFRQDLVELVARFRGLLPTAELDIKLESFTGSLCDRLHVDCLPLRLVCSLAGPGTQWVDELDIDRARLGPGGGSLPDDRSGLLRPGATIHQLPRFAVALMKGDRWPGNHGRALVHRSPKAEPGQSRVLFKIDANSW